MSEQCSSSWPLPPAHIAATCPNGFPEKDSEELKVMMHEQGVWACKYISQYLQRELSTIDRYEIMRITKDVCIEYFSGSYDLGVYEEVFTRYFLRLVGYVPEEVNKKLDGTREMNREKIRRLFQRLHAEAHHE